MRVDLVADGLDGGAVGGDQRIALVPSRFKGLKYALLLRFRSLQRRVIAVEVLGGARVRLKVAQVLGAAARRDERPLHLRHELVMPRGCTRLEPLCARLDLREHGGGLGGVA